MVSPLCRFTVCFGVCVCVFSLLLAVHAGIKAPVLNEMRCLTLMPFSDQMCNEMRCCDAIDLHPCGEQVGLL